MSQLADKLSHSIRVSTDILFVKNPMGTSLGIFFGIILQGLISLFETFYQINNKFISDKFGALYTIALGIFAFNIKPYLTRNKVSPQILEAIDHIDKLYRKGEITKIEKKSYYRQLINATVHNATFNQSTEHQIGNIMTVINKD